MKVLWLCNIALPKISQHLGMKPSNKEGWLSGISEAVSTNHDFELMIAFPVDKEHAGLLETIDGITYAGFYEDTVHPELYDRNLEKDFSSLIDAYKPDVVHAFGTEFPHTLAMARVLNEHPEKLLIGIQGVMGVIKDHYLDGVPASVTNRVTLRDFLRHDSLKQQKEKFDYRAVNEMEALMLTGNVTGRTPLDLEFAAKVARFAKYHFMNETLRKEFYEGRWHYEACKPHTIFLSQGNYPVKGVHYVLEALPALKKKYPDIKLVIAGDNITKHANLKERLKLSSYGKYLLELIKKGGLEDNVEFVGSIDAASVKEKLLEANLFLCPSTIENSPNSLGEAMLLGVPSVSANVGGISGIFKDGVDGIMYEAGNIEAMCEAITKMFDDVSLAKEYGENAMAHAHITHNPELNYKRLINIYEEITYENNVRVQLHQPSPAPAVQ